MNLILFNYTNAGQLSFLERKIKSEILSGDNYRYFKIMIFLYLFNYNRNKFLSLRKMSGESISFIHPYRQDTKQDPELRSYLSIFK